MQVSRRLTAVALGVGLVLGTGSAGLASPVPAAAPPTAEPTTRAQARPVTVTLLTGDRITLASADALTGSVQPAKGREKIQFIVQRDADHLYVIPRDAARLVGAGQLDRRLFDVTGLVQAGYHDAARDNLPLIVTYRDGAVASATGTLRGTGARVTRDLPAIGGAAVTTAKDQATAFWAGVTTGQGSARTATAGGIEKIWLDGKRQLTLDHSVPQIGAPAAYAAGFTGSGVTVAVLDSGVDVEHPDLVGRVAEARNFSEEADPRDLVGHGTHVASIIAGSGAASAGKYRGVAPDATLVSGKVCEIYGCTESAILAGLQWAAVEKQADVVNISLGGYDGPEIDPVEEAVNTLTAQTGTLFVVAAGNDGSDASVGSPGSADAALTVGAVDRDDKLAAFSSRGPRVGDSAVKPDITAPGVEIVAAKGAGTLLGTPVGEHYVAVSGTSMATPHVAGAVALLGQQHPDWSAAQFKSTLMASAKPDPTLTAYQQGAGRVDVARAITQPVTTDPASLSFGRAVWPHADDAPVSRTVTYHNSGSAALTLDLAFQVTGPEGASLPSGLFTTSANQVTVPAGGEATVTVTADTSVAGPDGYWSGRLTATTGSTVVTTPVGVDKEVESYDLTFTYIDQTGAPAVEYGSSLIGLDRFSFTSVYDDDGTATVRVPKGRYGLDAVLFHLRGEDEVDATMLAQPELVVDRNLSLTLDARQGRPVRVTVPDPSAAPALVDISANWTVLDGGFGSSLLSFTFDGLRTAQLGTGTSSAFRGGIASQWADPGADGQFLQSQYFYGLSDMSPGRFPTGYARHFRDRDLATVKNDFRGGAPGQTVYRFSYAFYPEPTGGWAVGLPVVVPGQRVEYYNTDDGVRWDQALEFTLPDADGYPATQTVLQVPAPVQYQAGRHYQNVWNGAPYGPSFPEPRWPDQGIFRQGNMIGVDLPIFSDAAGNPGGSLTETARTALYRNGKLVDEVPNPGWGRFDVPAGKADYRLTVSATRNVADLATSTEVAWTFRSGEGPVDEIAKLPAMAIRYAPKLDAGNAAPDGREFDIPVTVARQPGAPSAQVRQLTVEVSYDDGRTWRNASVKAGKSGWTASVRHPNGAAYVSLRAKATDSAGNTVTQKVIRAYKLK
ncbi:subtilase family protein [Micromonospora pisi]|uniref:Subtilase family protein n=1 Tax=Micromonospora pisi TaxID=589240 RepID=A0A495JI66_9ACTN|nr:subtilase family protein [Micromonospora pisi]